MVSNGSRIFLFGGGLLAFFRRPMLCHQLENRQFNIFIIIVNFYSAYILKKFIKPSVLHLEVHIAI